MVRGEPAVQNEEEMIAVSQWSCKGPACVLRTITVNTGMSAWFQSLQACHLAELANSRPQVDWLVLIMCLEKTGLERITT
jgi:hypothetical protein